MAIVEMSTREGFKTIEGVERRSGGTNEQPIYANVVVNDVVKGSLVLKPGEQATIEESEAYNLVSHNRAKFPEKKTTSKRE